MNVGFPKRTVFVRSVVWVHFQGVADDAETRSPKVPASLTLEEKTTCLELGEAAENRGAEAVDATCVPAARVQIVSVPTPLGVRLFQMNDTVLSSTTT